jgi:hypothetical protein
MGMLSRPRIVLALLVPAALLIGACAEAPPAQNPREARGAATYQQQAGYAGAGPLDKPGAAPSAMPPGQPPPWGIPGLVEVAPRTVPDAVAQLDRAEQLLGFVLAPSAGEVRYPPPPPNGSVGATADAPVPLGDPCLIACAALASMKRSADHVCTMAGDADATCGSARARVQRAEQRVTAACPACSSGK